MRAYIAAVSIDSRRLRTLRASLIHTRKPVVIRLNSPLRRRGKSAAIRTLISRWVEAYQDLDAKRLATLETPCGTGLAALSGWLSSSSKSVDEFAGQARENVVVVCDNGGRNRL